MRHLNWDNIHDSKVLEVGAYNVNGSLREYVSMLKPLSYTGVDMREGPGVDVVCDVNDIVEKFGVKSFDVVICTEMMEHVKNWRRAIYNMKDVLNVGGCILLTTRSKGFHRHDYPADYWRFEVNDMRYIFSNFVDVVVESDPGDANGTPSPGVFVYGVKTNDMLDLSDYNVYSMEEK
jgi:SAM-dependent methyltransferase